MKKVYLLCLCLFISTALGAQNMNGIVRGRIINSSGNIPVPYAIVTIENTTLGAVTDSLGNFEITGIDPGFRNVSVTAIGYKPFIYRDVSVTNAIPVNLELKIEENTTDLAGVEILSSPFSRTEESPVSLRTIGIAEIERNPGGNRDISSVLRSFPGVASTPAFRNDIIIRGGAPNENRFFLDDVEVPVINHFQTQGASGGPVGIINVNLIREVDFLSGAFPSNRGNALSSVLNFKQVDGNSERWRFRATLGSSDAGIKSDGPIGKKSSLIISARASYLQLLFSALRLPFLPTYYDLQFKYKVKFDERNELVVLGLGGLDFFRLNTAANETPAQRYLLNILPVNNQWNYTIGGTYRHFAGDASHLFVLSRNMLDNTAYKYGNNDESSESNKILDYASQESENRFRYEYTFRRKGWKLNAGLNAEYAKYTSNTYNRINTFGGIDTIRARSELHLAIGGIFMQVSKSLFAERLTLSLGFRMDNNSYNAAMANPLNQFSPRFSLSWRIIDRLFLNANAGRYFQRPSYTVLGYGDENGNLVNQSNALRYISCDHLVAGLEYGPTINTKITVEGFYKYYRDYPFSLRDSVTLANLGADYGVVGNVPAESRSEGRAYGVEVLVQQKLWKGFYGILSYTFVRSEFQDKDKNFVPSSWDSRHLVSVTAGYKFKRNWEVGARWRFVDGQPYTPYNVALSSLVSVWDITGQGIADYTLLNTERIPAFHQLDLRVDKVWYFKKWSLNVYVDVQNVYNFKAQNRPNLSVVTDENNNPVTDPNDNTRYLTEFLENNSGTVIPSIGVIVDF